MSCCDAGGRTKWGIFALLAVVSIALGLSAGPSYFGILASHSGPDSFEGCAHCLQDFGVEVLKSVNATDIADKLEKIHERNARNHPERHHRPPPPPHHHHHHHGHDQGPPDFEFDDNECITNKDIEDLKPDLESLVVPEWKEECKDVCTPVLKAVPLATTFSGILLFVALISGICSMIPLCMLCCGSCKDERPVVVPQWQHTYAAVPNAPPVGTYATGASSAAAPSDSAKTPLLQQKV